jgi:hypothetical protein
MATEQLGFRIGSEVAAADLSTKQFFGVKFTATGVALCSVAGEQCDGFLQNKPAAGAVCNVAVDGKSKAVAGGAIAKGARVTVTAAGKLAVAASGNYVLGIALEAATADGDIIGVLINRTGRVA